MTTVASVVGRTRWSTPEELPVLSSVAVHCWCAHLCDWQPHLAACDRLLAPDERARRDGFVMLRDRERFTLAHALKRLVLGAAAAAPAALLAFGAGAHGKPFLVGAGGPSDVHFNMSDTGDLVLIATARARAVGVDAEAWDPSVPDDELKWLTESAFSQAERAAVLDAPVGDMRRAFYATWSRKEAYLKATGDGITQGLDHFDVSMTAGDARLLVDRRDPEAAARWAMAELDVAPATAGCVVWARADLAPVQLACFTAVPRIFGEMGA